MKLTGSPTFFGVSTAVVIRLAGLLVAFTLANHAFSQTPTYGSPTMSVNYKTVTGNTTFSGYQNNAPAGSPNTLISFGTSASNTGAGVPLNPVSSSTVQISNIQLVGANQTAVAPINPTSTSFEVPPGATVTHVNVATTNVFQERPPSGSWVSNFFNAIFSGGSKSQSISQPLDS